MPSEKDLQLEFEERLGEVVADLDAASPERGVALCRALIHKAVHLAADTRGIEFCTIATYLGDMVSHAHGLMHPQGQPDRHDRPVH